MELKDIKPYKKYKAIRNSDKAVVRFGRYSQNNDMIFIYGRRRKNYGWIITEQEFLANYTIMKTRATEKSKWEHNVDRVIKTLEKSGLWDNILEVFRNLKKLGWDKRKELSEEWNNIEDRSEYKDGHYHNTAEYNVWLDKVEKEYPFLISVDEHGERYVSSQYFWEMSYAQLKNMYFGKWYNKDRKEEIAKCLAEKKPLRFCERVSYDVSFEYNAELGKAWYSEEYKGCGNGHYYLALDNNLALFCEND